ncbi:hypothetical protein, partial [Pseudomonas aeruginosa]|uniref:hypothetical protein n=1 Tax=Pseudomonas aeruginosa TaxID=287 RepID=UPI0039830052
TTDLNGGALFNAEFGIRHRGSTVPERSGVALSFCRRRSKNKFVPIPFILCLSNARLLGDYGGVKKSPGESRGGLQTSGISM